MQHDALITGRVAYQPFPTLAANPLVPLRPISLPKALFPRRLPNQAAFARPLRRPADWPLYPLPARCVYPVF